MPYSRSKSSPWIQGAGDADVDHRSRELCIEKNGRAGCDFHWRPCNECWLDAIVDTTVRQFSEDYHRNLTLSGATRPDTPNDPA